MSDSLSSRIGSLITLDLLKALDELYPLRLPDPKDSPAELWIKVGERRLVEVLHAKYAEANDPS
ncbi:hypothetical protein [Paraburkholderia susongensis]|uniref:Uncharacterized protein n=1 Tax=Paraburkholderia susongensis TaxID=1515439 RepID=A0A1X7KP49_9BURK|nr:hypothetical protein [Paraburkholderia susongensis]SMG43338.1 hypothetical protein SAMN06265784_104151 [Paraburkholderia susongensis]